MNKILEPFSQTKITPGFINGFVNDELVYELICEYIGRDKKWYGIIKDEMKNENFDAIKALTEAIYAEDAEIIEICEGTEDSDDITAFIYKHEDITVAFIMKMSWTVAFWAK